MWTHTLISHTVQHYTYSGGDEHSRQCRCEEDDEEASEERHETLAPLINQ
jgi:hypothetical protein